LYLGNLLLKVRDLRRDQRESVIANTLRDVLSSEELSPDEFVSSLALRVRTPQDIHLRRRILQVNGHAFREPVTFGDGELFLELISDKADTVSTVSKENLEKAFVSLEDAYRIAAARLVRATGETQWTPVQGTVWASSYEDDYDFARLVAAKTDARLPFESEPRVFAPSHTVCLITDTDDESVLREMIELGQQRSANHRPFSQLLWTRDPHGLWTQWKPVVEAKGWKVSELQRVKETLTHYAEQKSYLEQLLESRNEDGFVANYQAFERDMGCRTLCTYTLNLPSYLPRTDVVAIVDPSAGESSSVLGQITWGEFEDVLGRETLVRMIDEVPARFRLTNKLTPAQQSALRRALHPLD
jgi:hypothetical protein